jgi:hypothetical protein
VLRRARALDEHVVAEEKGLGSVRAAHAELRGGMHAFFNERDFLQVAAGAPRWSSRSRAVR